jgi:DnaA family protein
MKQLPLEIRLADYALFDTFYDGPNGEPVHALRTLSDSRQFELLWLWGAVDTGKTHLLQAAVNAADGNEFRSAYLPLGAGFELSPEVLEGMGDFDVICIDDIDAVAGSEAWEQALFRLFESLRQGQGRLVVAASESPLHCRFALPDLVSRFSSGATFRLTQLSDEDKLSAMQLRANWRGLELSDDTARYVISRVGRGCSQLFSLLDQLDREALTAQKKLTIPFVKAVMSK